MIVLCKSCDTALGSTPGDDHKVYVTCPKCVREKCEHEWSGIDEWEHLHPEDLVSPHIHTLRCLWCGHEEEGDETPCDCKPEGEDR